MTGFEKTWGNMNKDRSSNCMESVVDDIRPINTPIPDTQNPILKVETNRHVYWIKAQRVYFTKCTELDLQ